MAFIFKHLWHCLKSKQNKISLKQANSNINIQNIINVFCSLTLLIITLYIMFLIKKWQNKQKVSSLPDYVCL